MKNLPPIALTASCLLLAPVLGSASNYDFSGPDSEEDQARLKADAGQLDRFEPGGFWPSTDGAHLNAHGAGLLYQDGTYYLVGERRAEWASEGINLFSSTDLYNWKLEGNILPPVDKKGHDIERGCIMERPKILFNENTGKYVLWFHLELANQGYNAARVGVAQADKITGPFEFIRSMRPNGHDSRDMTVFKDDGATAYLIYASEHNFMLRAARLTDDYLDVTERDEALFRRHREAPAIIRHNGKLFLFTSACTSWDPNPAGLHVAESIWGPWEHLPNPARGDGADITFDSQPTFILPVQGRENAFIYLGNRWQPGNLLNSQHVWLPIEFDNNGLPFFRWHDQWDLSVFDQPTAGG